MSARRGSVRYEVQLACDAATAWALVGAPARLAEWFPGIVSCSVDGTTRTITTGAGLTLPEELLTVDPLRRRFQYRITAPLFTEHLGTIDVIALGEKHCLVTYATDADPAVLALLIGGAAGAGLRALPTALGVEMLGVVAQVPGAPGGGSEPARNRRARSEV